MIKKLGFYFIILICLIISISIIGFFWLRAINIPNRGGTPGGTAGETQRLAVLDAPVTVKRDRQGIPYIYADTLADALRAQSFVTAQDRLSQMLLTRELIHGRLAEQTGEAGLRSDRLVRVTGLSRMGRVWAQQLESPSRELHEWYLEGVNAYIATQQHEFPLAVRLSSGDPAPFTLEDLTTQYLFLAFNSASNWRSELLSQALVDHLGSARAAEISMLSVNPDDESEWAADYRLAENPAAGAPAGVPQEFAELPDPVDGSNSWATSARRSSRGAPILANDPHINVRRVYSLRWSVAENIGDQIGVERVMLAPLIVAALQADAGTLKAAAILQGWDYFDEADLAAPALFQAIMNRLVLRVFEDDLGEDLSRRYAVDIYYWQERLHRMLLAGDSEWFDDRRTERTEGRDDMLRAATQDAWAELTARLGPDPHQWRWGDLSRLRFSNPWVPGRLADRLLGGGDYSGRGSGETLGRARFPGLGNYDPRVIDSLRFVADLGDPDKVLAVIPGGVSARLFDPHLNDQLPLWLSQEVGYWWFSDQAIAADTRKEMKFAP